MNLKYWLVKQKFRFDLATSFLTLLNFFLLVSVNSEKLKIWFGIKSSFMIILIFGSLSLMLVWLMGVVLDIIKYPHIKYGIESGQNPVFTEISEHIKNIKRIIDDKKP